LVYGVSLAGHSSWLRILLMPPDREAVGGEEITQSETVYSLTIMLKFTFAAGIVLVFHLGVVLHAQENGLISSIGGRYFKERVELSVTPFAQDDPRWSDVHLGGSTDTLGDEGCAVTSAAMVAVFYGVKTDPQMLNAFLTRSGGLDNEGLIDWSQVSAVAPKRWKLVYDGAPNYELIDSNLLTGNPVIAVIPLPHGNYHFVVIVGKEGRDYLIRDPAGSPLRPVYPLRYLTDQIQGLCFFRAPGWVD
jgi:hypothetical protein